MIKLLIGGSPCTHWSIAQTKNRETEPSGIGWELFKNYLIAKEKFQPDFFLYENNKSAAPQIKEQIKVELGVDDGTLFTVGNPARYIEINSALVSAQNRQRFYVHNCGDVEQPSDRGIFLRDILESGETDREKGRAVLTSAGRTTCREYFTKQQGNMVAEPVCLDSCQVGALPRPNGELSTSQAFRIYSDEAKSVTLKANGGGAGAKTGLYAIPCEAESLKIPEATKQGYAEIQPGECVDLNHAKSKTRRGRSMKEKSNCLTATNSELYQYCGTVDKPIYKVENGEIEIKGKKYPIKLIDGYYIIRKLTVKECCRLQTMPDDYCRAVSDSRAYTGLGNGWTAEVIIHILSNALKDVPRDEEIVVLSMYDGIGTGRYCLDKMGFTNVKYFAYEIDKYAMQISMSNYPDIIQMGDAFQIREDGWALPVV